MSNEYLWNKELKNATAHVINVFPWFHQHYAGALKHLAQGHSHEKLRGSIAVRTHEPWITIQTLYH